MCNTSITDAAWPNYPLPLFNNWLFQIPSFIQKFSVSKSTDNFHSEFKIINQFNLSIIPELIPGFQFINITWILQHIANMAALEDISNRSFCQKQRKRLSDGTVKEYTYTRIRKKLPTNVSVRSWKAGFWCKDGQGIQVIHYQDSQII